MNIDHWDESIEVSFKNVKDIMAKAKHKKTSPVEKEDLLRELDKLFKRIQDLTKSYRREMLQIGNTTEKQECKQRYNEFVKQLKQYQKDAKWMKQAQTDQEIFGEQKPVERFTDDQVADHMLQTQKQDINMLETMVNTVGDIKNIGLETADKMAEQTNQLERINAKASGIQSDIKRANKLLYAYRRKMMQDRATVILLLFIVLAIVGIIIYSVIVPDQSEFAVPDEAKPPTAEEINKVANRL